MQTNPLERNPVSLKGDSPRSAPPLPEGSAHLSSENYFRLLFEISPMPMWVFETQGLRFLEVNQAAMRHYGYTREEFLQMNLLDIRPESEIPVFLNYLKNAGQTPNQYTYTGDWIHRRKDGTLLTVEIASHRFLFEGRNAVLSVMIDITERRKTEVALRESEDRFRLLSEAAVEAVLIHQNLIIKEVNLAFMQMLGYSDYSEVIGKNIMEFVGPEFREMSLSFVRAQSEKIYEMQLVRRNGTRVDIAVRGRAIQYHGGVARVATVTDITDRKQKEEVLREREARLRIVCEQMPAVLWSTDQHLRLMSLSGAALDRMGITADQMIGRSLEDVLANFGRRPAAHHQEALEGKSVSFEVNFGERFFQTHIEPMRDSAGVVNGTIGVAMDITDLKNVENQLRETAIQLTRSNKELEQFAYVTSHDLQEPLRMVASYMSLIERRFGERMETEALEFVQFAVDGARRMKQLIDDLLAFSRLTTSDETFREVDMEAALSAAMRNLALSISESKCQVERGHMPIVWGDFTLLVTLFQNLLGNAIKFRKTGEPCRIQISATPTTDGWDFTVRDSGIGFNQEYSQKIFRLFQRLHNKEDYPGTGIGLAICQKIVEAHGGKIWADSVIGEGASFHFSLTSPATHHLSGRSTS